MSLLLDALKKAAEQKAEKSREDIPQAETSDETIVVSAPEDISELEDADNVLQSSRRELEDETQIDDSRLQTQHEDTHLERGTDETRTEIPDQTETQHTDLSTQMQTGEDETIIFADGDVSDFMGEPELVNRQPQDRPGDDQTEVQTHIEPHDESPAEDETEVDQTYHQTNVPQQDSEPTHSKTELDLTESQEDMSLLLVERDNTDFTARTSLTDPKLPQDQTETLKGDDAGSDGLALQDTTRHKLPDDVTQTRSATQTSPTGTNVDTQSTATRTDSTGTYTYAPDNYDRTLMKLPSEDASRLFAGMKNESDAVMTPDYAKKVFRSKSSAQRLHNFKIYAGIMVVIFLGIGIFGAFEFQDQAHKIDTGLRPLKRDPMPGLIKPGNQEQDTNLFAEAEPAADVRTIEIIENAESTAAGIEEVATGSTEIEEAVETVDSEVTAREPEIEVAVVGQQQTQSAQITNTEVTSITQIEVEASEPESSSSNLQISSSSQIGQRDVLLREAYDAYKAGNVSLALARYNQVLEQDPGNRNALLARAAINVQNGDGAAAIKDYQALLLANPKDSLAMASLITVANYSPWETESQLKLMIREEPSSPHLNFALANVYGAQNRWQEAQGHYFRALQSNPGDPNYAYNLAVSLEHISQPGSAITYYRRALDNLGNGPATFNRDVVDQRLELLAIK
ncbi:MAG: tetratricopeptide repeat protein [Gammaproteobacteria bacterium]|nr:tetratricopeptide repeat protein [Gammaproteobacteria bacterium]